MSPCLCLLLGHCCLRTKHSTYNKQCQATASLGTTLSIAISFYQCNSLSKIKFFTTHKAKNEGRGVRPTRFEFRHPSALTPLQAPKVLSIPLWRYTGTGYLICGRLDWYGVPRIRVLAACHCQVPGHSCHSEHICEKCCHLAHRGQNMGEAGKIRFVKMAIFFGGSTALSRT
jgi:hypothetical protein